jgi:ubiquinone/menaquinone biosynthesis C-methylase UbiE
MNLPGLGPKDEDALTARILEPELMDDPAQVDAYASADFAAVNQGFVDRLRAEFPKLCRGRVLDLGCGPADIPARLSSALPHLQIAAVDGALAMLATARHRTRRGLSLVAARADRLPFRPGSFDACVSNSLMHHLADPLPCWQEIRRICRTGAAIFVMDLSRAPTRTAAHAIVEREAATEPAILRRDFYNSLLAAFTPEEVRAQLDQVGLSGCRCELVSDRHWLAWGTAT